MGFLPILLIAIVHFHALINASLIIGYHHFLLKSYSTWSRSNFIADLLPDSSALLRAVFPFLSFA